MFNKEYKFQYYDNTLRVVYLDFIPWFSAVDIASILDEMNPRHLMGVALDKDESKRVPINANTDSYYINIKAVFRCMIDKEIQCAETNHFENWFIQNLPSIFCHPYKTEPEKELIEVKPVEKTPIEKIDFVYDKIFTVLAAIEDLQTDVKELYKKYY
jgi:prophage antirepressor-like protein